MARAKTPATPAKSAKTAKATKASKPTPSNGQPTPEELYRMIQETAYYKAKARNFAPGNEVQDWIEAEAEVRQRIDSRP